MTVAHGLLHSASGSRRVFVLALLTFAARLTGEEVITNETVIRMTKADLSEQLIIDIIKYEPGNFTLNPSAALALKKAGVAAAVITAMRAKWQTYPRQDGSLAIPKTR